uniref:hypothetical protein n=1 Tax=Actinoplanes sp. CA-151224 TaxID=3239904 RepID=UPI003F493CDE
MKRTTLAKDIKQLAALRRENTLLEQANNRSQSDYVRASQKAQSLQVAVDLALEQQRRRS